ncbi:MULTISPECIES: DUF721 domain-containing protein [Vibrio]|uniref:DUF721 domain-containing protein n=1 Tax=Vibrio casei TaxID=673372 RepID=A0A368LKS1_9VIBR|nr:MULTISPECIES: DciA family protein [Vibrio]RCS72499.1 DUF721 domain-containing protein [Vibrio casei]SJN36354.1 Zn-ribbon-containing, possibly RNA-binding protein and truncated derivatives [Vibrio casei]HBV75158.1 DUF721 domain-containing protein [Vibrio sp.]
MRDHRPKLTQNLIEDSSLKKFTQHVSEILAINAALKTIISPNMLDYCRAANVRQSQLLIEVANASLQMKLNYERIRILSELRSAGFSKLVGIEFKVNPDLYRAESVKEKKKIYKYHELSQDAAHSMLMLSELASPKLKLRLESLARLANKPKK